jgi:hypothetical protein
MSLEEIRVNSHFDLVAALDNKIGIRVVVALEVLWLCHDRCILGDCG